MTTLTEISMLLINSIILSIIVTGLRYLMPTKITAQDIGLPMSKFKKTYRWLLLIWIVFGMAFSVLTYFLFLPTISGVPEGYIYNLYPDQAYWFGITAMVGFAIGVIALFTLVRVNFKEHSNLFWAYYDLRYKLRATTVLKVLTLILGIGGIILIHLGGNSHFLVNEKIIKVSRLLEVDSKAYTMQEISEIRYLNTFIAPNGNEVLKPHYEIVFQDGYKWNTRIDLREPRETDDKVFKEISQNSGINIMEVK